MGGWRAARRQPQGLDAAGRAQRLPAAGRGRHAARAAASGRAVCRAERGQPRQAHAHRPAGAGKSQGAGAGRQRPPHGPAQPPHVQRAGRQPSGAGAAQPQVLCADVPGSGPFQGHQRHAGPPCRRPAAAGRRTAPAPAAAQLRHHCAHGRRRVRGAGHRHGRDGRHGRAGRQAHRPPEPAL
ncbi:hypothetical protein D3C71_1236130 [compost metagenome]